MSESISTALAIAISGSDLYIVGNVFEDDRIQAVYWKNDIRVDLSDGVHECKASSIAVVGNDVYVSGTLNLNGISVARYWKNGVPVDLTDTTTVVATASSIFVSGTDVYVAGQQALIQGNTLKVSTAIYWKNGSPVLLSNGIHDARALSIYVSENQVHVVGYEQYFDINNSIAKYWIDGYELTVSGNTGKYISFAKATSIVVAGGNIYAAVQEGDPANNTSFAKYWRDGCTINLTEGSSITDINSMFVVE